LERRWKDSRAQIKSTTQRLTGGTEENNENVPARFLDPGTSTYEAEALDGFVSYAAVSLNVNYKREFWSWDSSLWELFLSVLSTWLFIARKVIFTCYLKNIPCPIHPAFNPPLPPLS
jgi:hypothetical protein